MRYIIEAKLKLRHISKEVKIKKTLHFKHPNALKVSNALERHVKVFPKFSLAFIKNDF